MKKLLLPFAFLLFLQQLNAQKVKVGFTAGGNLSNIYAKIEDEKENLENKVGFQVGMFTDIPIVKGFSIQPTLNFIQKGGKTSEGGEKISLNLNYLELPLNFVYSFKTSPVGNFFIGAGPYIAGALYSNVKAKIGSEEAKESISFGKTTDNDMRGFDAGANFITGFITKKGLIISAFYSRGFYDLNPVRIDGEYMHNQSFGVRLGWLCKAQN
ncbi:MAG: porin family protein [Ferruginibacter sp.]